MIKFKKYKILTLISLFLFFITSILIIISLINESKWLTISYQYYNNFSNFNETIIITYTLNQIVLSKAILNQSNQNLNNISINGTTYSLPFACPYDDEYNNQFNNICTLGINSNQDQDNFQLNKLQSTSHSIKSLIYLSTFLILLTIIGQKIIDFFFIKPKRSRFLVSFRLIFILSSFFLVLSNCLFSIAFKKYILNHTKKFKPIAVNEVSYNLNLTGMVFSIIASILIFSTFCTLYKKFKRTIFYGNERVGYSILYI